VERWKGVKVERRKGDGVIERWRDGEMRDER